MTRYDPERMELSTRDRVALAAYTEIKEGRGTPRGGVWLDVSHLPREQIMERLPRVYRTLMELQMVTSPPRQWKSRRPRTTPWVESGCAPATTAPG
jgi:succinate dehydrogenase/fumarate reductase flavoprotein subunit